MWKCLNITYTNEAHLVFLMSRNVIDSRTSVKTVVESKTVFCLCTKFMLAEKPQQWFL